MKYLIFGADGCSRCWRVKKHLEEQGHEIIEHTSEYHSLPKAGWRDKPVEFAEHMAQLSYQNQELPAVYCADSDSWVDVDGILEG